MLGRETEHTNNQGIPPYLLAERSALFTEGKQLQQALANDLDLMQEDKALMQARIVQIRARLIELRQIIEIYKLTRGLPVPHLEDAGILISA